MEASCIICHETFDSLCDIVAIKCGHVFHCVCITQWHERSPTCPECRASIDDKDIKKLFFKPPFDDSSEEEPSLDELKEILHEKEQEISAKNKKIEELTASYEKLLENRNEYATMLDSRNTRLRIAEVNSMSLSASNSILKDEIEHLKNVQTMVKGSSNDANRILREYVSSDGATCRKLAEFCSVIKQHLAENIHHSDQIQQALTELKSQNVSLQENLVQYQREVELHKSERLTDASSRSLRENVCVNSTPKCAPRCDIVRCDNEMTPIPLDFPASKKRKMQSVVLDRELPSIPTQVPQRALLTPAMFVVPSRPEDSVSSIPYNGLDGNERGVPGNISQIPAQVPEVPNLCPSRFSLSLRPENEEHVSRVCNCPGHHGLGVVPGSGVKRVYKREN